jgi:hypothetical protein
MAPDIYPEEQAVAKALDIARAGDLLVNLRRQPRPRLGPDRQLPRSARPEGAGEDATTAEAAVMAGKASTAGEDPLC